LQLKHEHRRWYVIVITEAEPVPLPMVGRTVGVDVGVARFLTTSDGQIAAHPRFLQAAAEVIADLQRRKERARRGSGNRKRIRRQLGREWRKIRNRRRDFHHKTARILVSTCDGIALEKLNTVGMTRRPAPKPDPRHPGSFLPNMATAKAGLTKRSSMRVGLSSRTSSLAKRKKLAGESCS
jgi:putative transposase